MSSKYKLVILGDGGLGEKINNTTLNPFFNSKFKK